ncbi:MAG: AMP-dependent synthetase/ligase [Anaerovoracaceae bacterium]
MSDFRDKYWFNDIRPITTLKELLYGSVELYEDRPAFWVKKKKGEPYEAITYGLLKHDVEALCAQLHAMGLSNERIGVIGQGCYEWIVTYLAVVIGGGVVVPLDKELEPAALQNVLGTAQCRTVFYTSDLAPRFRNIEGIDNHVIMQFYGDRTDPAVPLISEAASGAPDEQQLQETAENGAAEQYTQYTWKELAGAGENLIRRGGFRYAKEPEQEDTMSVLLFTSGTTGNPKGVMLSQRNITANIMDTCRIANIHPTDKTLSILPIHHTYECTFGMLLVLYRGASTAFCEGLKYITKNMEEAGNSVFIAVPLVLEMIYEKIWKQAKKQGKDGMLRRAIRINNKSKALGIDMSRMLFRQIHQQLGGNLRMIITGAAALSPSVFRGFEDLGIKVLQGYGLTECTPLVSGTPESAKERYRKAGSVGVAVASGEFRVENPDENGIGEIYFRGPNVMLGYYNMPEETEKVLKDGWFATGDLGFTDREGWLYLTGRQKNVIVTKSGKNIYPEEIEEVLNRLSFITECMVYGQKRDNEDIVAVQVLPDLEKIQEELGYLPDENELYRLIKNAVNEANMSLTSYKRVKEVIIRKEDFVRTSTKKIRRQDNIPQEG